MPGAPHRERERERKISPCDVGPFDVGAGSYNSRHMPVPYRQRSEHDAAPVCEGSDEGSRTQHHCRDQRSTNAQGPTVESRRLATSPMLTTSTGAARVSIEGNDGFDCRQSPELAVSPKGLAAKPDCIPENIATPLKDCAVEEPAQQGCSDTLIVPELEGAHPPNGADRLEPAQREESVDSSAPTVNAPQDAPLMNGRWRIERTLGKGSFGTIKLATDIKTGEEVAIKMERKSGSSQLTHERRVYRIINGSPGFPRVHAVGENDTQRYLVMDRMGPSLEEFLSICGRIALPAVMQIAVKMISRMQVQCTEAVAFLWNLYL